MLMPWDKVKLIAETSSGEVARITNILKENNIKYECVTKKNESTFGSMIHSSMGASVGGGGGFTYSQAVGPINYVYIIYVSRKMYTLANSLIK